MQFHVRTQIEGTVQQVWLVTADTPPTEAQALDAIRNEHASLVREHVTSTEGHPRIYGSIMPITPR